MTGTWGNGCANHVRKTSRILLIVAACGLLLIPSVTGTGSEDPADRLEQKELEMGLPLSMKGMLAAKADQGAFTMGPLDEDASEFALRIQAASMDLKLINVTQKSLTGTAEGDRVLAPTEDTPTVVHHEFEEVTLRLDHAVTGFYLLAHALDSPGGAQFNSEPLSRSATLDTQEAGRVLSYADNPAVSGNHYTETLTKDMLTLVGGDPFSVITGDFTVVLFETPLDLDHANGKSSFKTGETRQGAVSSMLPAQLPADLPVEPLVNKHTQYAVLELKDARLAIRSIGPEAELITPYESITIDVDGSVESPSLLGSIHMNDELIQMRGDSARLEGKFTMEPTGAKGENRALFNFQGDVETLTVGPQLYQSETSVTQAAGLAIVLAGLGATVWQVAKNGLLVTLYAKLTRRKVLDQATRQQVHDKVGEDPGCTTRTVSDALGISWSTAAYHLRVLRHMGLITTKRQGRHEHFFVTGNSSQSQQRVQAALQNPTTRKIAHLISRNPGIIQKDVCDMLGIAPSTASDHLKRLRESGAVREEREWRTRAYYPEQLLAQDLLPVYEGYAVQQPLASAGTSA